MRLLEGLPFLDRWEFSLAGTDSPLAAVLFLAAAVLLALLGYAGFTRGREGSPGWLPAALRVSAVALAALLFLQPVLKGVRKLESKPRVAVLVDTSMSMGIEDEAMGASRLAEAERLLLDPGKGLIQRLEEFFEVERYHFAGKVERIETHAAAVLSGRGDRTELAEALEEAARHSAEGEPAALVVLTDGRETGARSVREGLPGCPPVHAVGLGIPEEAPLAMTDAAVTRLTLDSKVLLGDCLEIMAAGRVTALKEASPLTLELLVDGAPVLLETVPAPPPLEAGASPFECAFTWVPERPGLHEIGIRVQAVPGETCLANNARFAPVQVSSRRIELLLYEPRPRWEYKFLRRTLSLDPHLNLTSLVRTGPGHYLQQGEASVDLTRGLPDSPEALSRFDAVLLGDVRADDFAPRAMEALQRYVAEGMGGLVLYGSSGALGPGGLKGTLLEGVLPVNIPANAENRTGRFPVHITAAGASHPLTRGLEGLLAREASREPLESLIVAGSLKPGGQVLAGADAGGGAWLPFLAAHRYGGGRAAAVLSESTWKWAMGHPPESGPEGLHARFWGRLARWASGREAEDPMAADGDLLLERNRLARGERTTLRVKRPLEGLTGTMTDDEGGKIPVFFHADADGAAATLAPEAGGLHTIRVEAEGGLPVGEALLYVDRSFLETEAVTQDRELLAFLARSTGGAYHTPAAAGGLPDAIRQEALFAMERIEWRLKDQPFFYGVLVVLLALEWVLRRRAGIL